MEKCENCHFITATQFLRIGNCVDCSIFSYTSFCAPIIYGDTRNIVMAPHNTAYTELAAKVTASNININNEGNLHLFKIPLSLQSNQKNYSVMNPADFIKLSLPKKFQETQLFLCPKEYLDALQLRQENFQMIQAKIKSS